MSRDPNESQRALPSAPARAWRRLHPLVVLAAAAAVAAGWAFLFSVAGSSCHGTLVPDAEAASLEAPVLPAPMLDIPVLDAARSESGTVERGPVERGTAQDVALEPTRGLAHGEPASADHTGPTQVAMNRRRGTDDDPRRAPVSLIEALSVDEPEDVAGITAAHNAVRAAVRTDDPLPELRWDPALAAWAQAWADELARRGCAMEHRPRSGRWAQQHGENLLWSAGAPRAAAQVVQSWASEDAFYDTATNTCTGVCGHYTQVVWRDSVRLGCARSTCTGARAQLGFEELWVCNYDPPGNVVGRHPYRR